MDRKAHGDDVLTAVKVFHNSLSYYKRDQLHFNAKGLDFVAGKLADHMKSNFPLRSQITRL